MKTVRFSQVVKKAGRPSAHLQLVSTSKDRTLQRAAKLHRVMTVNQDTVGHSADYGMVGLDPELKGQILIFPKSLAKFTDKRVVGIKYDMLEQPAIPTSALAPKAKPKRAKNKRARGTRASREGSVGQEISAPQESPEAALEKTSPKQRQRRPANEDRRSSPPIASRKVTKRPEEKVPTGIRRAIQALESGHSVKAYNILKNLLPNH